MASKINGKKKISLTSYGDIQEGDKLANGMEAWTLVVILDGSNAARGQADKPCKIFLRPAFRLPRPLNGKPECTEIKVRFIFILSHKTYYYFTSRTM